MVLLLNISQFADSVVLHFETEERQINAYTLASTLVAIADAAKAANAAVNPGYDIEVVVEALGPGSFRAKITAIYKGVGNLFSGQSAKTIILGIITFVICKHIWPDQVNVIINTDEVIIERGSDRIVVPRQVYDAHEQAEKNPQFRNAIAKTFAAASSDEKVKGIGFVKEMSDPRPNVIVSRETMRRAAIPIQEDPEERVITEQCDLDIVKAILEPGKRKWEFVWRGNRITAPVLDESFFARFKAHEITIAPGDQLRVLLAMKQRRDPNVGVYTNESFTVIQVFEHVPAVRPNRLQP